MKAIIPVAGVGTRLRPHTYTNPKVLLNLGGKPIIAYIIDNLVAEGIDNIILILGYMGEQIKNYVKEHYDVNFQFYYQEKRKGLAHAIYLAESELDDSPAFIALGDTIFNTDLSGVLDGKYSSMGVKDVDDPRRFGVVIRDESGFITRLVEKPKQPISHSALVGLYYFCHGSTLRSALKELIERDIRTRGEYQITDSLQLMVEHGEKITTFPVEGWYDCGNRETLLSTHRFILSEYHNNPEGDSVQVQMPVYISESALVKNAIIGPNVTVADGAEVKNAIISDSIIGENAVVENIVLDQSIIGNSAIVCGQINYLNVGDSSEVVLSNQPISSGNE